MVRGGLLAFGVWAGTLVATMPAAAAPRPVAVTITSVECIEAQECDAGGIEAFGESWPDFYARVYIDGFPADTPRAPDDQKRITPFWTVSRTVDDAGRATVPVTIQIWDHDSSSGDDIADASPARGRNNLDLSVDLATGTHAGDTATGCATGDGVDTDDDDYYPVRVCFAISTLSDSGDLDRDGLLDGWETSGLDADGDGLVDLNLPQWGANPRRQDLFLELDYQAGREPSRSGIDAMRKAFARAPRPNPDGSTGITLHVDTGALSDPAADEADSVATCSDGIDNNGNGLTDAFDAGCALLGSGFEGRRNCGNGIDDDGDGLADALDPQCRVGDDLGGGSAIAIAPADVPCGIDKNPGFARLKTANFDERRNWVFRYGLQAASTGAVNCAGGQGEIGGNDFASHNQDAGTLMHELGHNLGLQHGGSNDMNCKPDYVSVMNYNFQIGIPRVAGGSVLDYSPPILALGGAARGGAPLATLVENALSETVPVDGTDGANQTIFTNGAGGRSTIAINGNPDWSGGPGAPAAIGVNIDDNAGGGPRDCDNATTDSVLAGDDDWSRVQLNLRQFAASAPGMIAASPEEPPTEDEMRRMQAESRRTDLALGLAPVSSRIVAGTRLEMTATILNTGRNLAAGTHVDIAGANVARLYGPPPAGCGARGMDRLSCDIGPLGPGESRAVDLSTLVPADLVHNAGAPIDLAATVSVGHQAGDDSNPANNAAGLATRIVARSDLSVALIEAPNRPTVLPVGQPVVVEIASTLGSAGPSSPMDAALTFAAQGDAGLSATPTRAETMQAALRQGDARRIAHHPILTCHSPGWHTLRVSQQIAPARPDDTDPVPANDAVDLVVTVRCDEPDPGSPAQPGEPSGENNACEPSVPTTPAQPRSATGLLRALRQAGVDASLPENEILPWLSVCPPTTAYPAIGQAILRNGWRLASPVHFDVIIWVYEDTMGTSPREIGDVSVDALKRAILAASNERYGTRGQRFDDLLEPR